MPLPGGYGHGSTALAFWIAIRMAEDSRAGNVHYPPAWGEAPRRQTRDLRALPFGYGQGSSVLAAWIARSARRLSGEDPLEYQKAYANSGLADAVTDAIDSRTSNASEYPESWGEPPKDKGLDKVPLPGGYGYGDDTLADWILANMEKDRYVGELQFPTSWGEPPLAQTMDLRPLPFGYGLGSSTILTWIRNSAKRHSGERPEEYTLFWGSNHSASGGGVNGKVDPEAEHNLTFPSNWSAPPAGARGGTRVPLPGGYGFGGTRLAQWIRERISNDQANGQVHYPPGWGEPPNPSEDEVWRELPFGYGIGPESLVRWIEEQALAKTGERPDDYDRLSLRHRSRASTRSPYPQSWGRPPTSQVKDLVPLPGGYGHGSSTLAHWILRRMREDARAGHRQFPRAWGDPPLAQTSDLRPLPFGYGKGSGSLATWIVEQARKHGGEVPEEYSPGGGHSVTVWI